MSSPDVPTKQVDGLLKSMMVLSRTVGRVLESQAVEQVMDGPMSFSKVQILRLLGHRGSQTPSQIARFLGVTTSAVTQVADTMVRSKLVARERSTNRREVLLTLSPQGRERFHTLTRKQRHIVRTALRGTGTAKLKRWNTTLLDMASSLVAADKAAEQFCLQCGAHADGTCVLVGGDAECLFLRHAH